MSRSGITMARSTVLVDFDAPIASCDVDFRVMFLVVGLKLVDWSVNLMLDSAFKSVSDSASDSAFDSALDSALDSAFDSVVGEVVGPVMHLAVASLVLLKLTSRLVRIILLTGFHSLNMVVVSYFNSYNFSDRGANLPSSLACDLSAYAAHPKVLICL
jgi:hypothetical protein